MQQECKKPVVFAFGIDEPGPQVFGAIETAGDGAEGLECGGETCHENGFVGSTLSKKDSMQLSLSNAEG